MSIQNPMQQTLIGESPPIQKVIQDVHRIADSLAASTLIIGESGTGKELVARMIHHNSPIADQPFIDINCGAIPESLLESELFGYEKGAFTGAHMRKKGMFELANGGTIFLDEIGNTSESFQMKLLKVVEYKHFRRIGGTTDVHVSTRIIAATNIDLLQAVQEGKFREDLYYRLNVFQIRIPPLRERGQDILLLADHFIRTFNRVYHRQVRGITPEGEQLLLNYSWPGNVRQLKNAVERAVVQTNDAWLYPEDFRLDPIRYAPPAMAAPAVHHPAMPSAAPAPNYPAPSPASRLSFNRIEIPDSGIALESFERDIIMSALEKAEGNLSRAARLLKISRGKLRYRLERLGISQKDVMAIKFEAMSY